MLTDAARAALRAADPALLAAARLGRYALYHELRAAAGRVVPLDSFYVGFRCGERQVIYPYNWDGQAYDDPNANTFAPDGLTAHLLTTGKPYRAAQDGGILLHRGRRFGDTARRSEDAMAVPWRSGRGEVTGLVSVLSYRSGVYDASSVGFLEALVRIAVTAAEREAEDAARRGAYGPAPDADDAGPLTRKLRQLREAAAALRDALGDDPRRAEAERLCRLAEQLQTEAFERPATPRLDSLTPRERQIALLLRDGLTNAAIGEALCISELTAKTHVAAVLRKLGVAGRSAVALLLKDTPTE